MPHSDPQPALGDAVRALRKRVGLSQETLAERSELSRSEVSRIEAGLSDPLWGDMRRIAKGLGVPLEELAELAEELENRA